MESLKGRHEDMSSETVTTHDDVSSKGSAETSNTRSVSESDSDVTFHQNDVSLESSATPSQDISTQADAESDVSFHQEHVIDSPEQNVTADMSAALNDDSGALVDSSEPVVTPRQTHDIADDVRSGNLSSDKSADTYAHKKYLSITRRKGGSMRQTTSRESSEHVNVDITDSSPKQVIRHHTQPVTLGEQEQVKMTVLPDIPAGCRTPLADRLSALRKYGEENWKKQIREKPVNSHAASSRPVSIADRLSLLNVSQETWKAKVQDNDAKQFTVEHKMNRQGKIGDSPLLLRQRVAPPPGRDINETSETMAENEAQKNACNNNGTANEDSLMSSPVRVEVPCIDEENLSTFFGSYSTPSQSVEKAEASVDVFNDIFIDSDNILPVIRRVKPKRTERSSAENPIKRMSLRTDIQQEYTQMCTGIAAEELKRIKRQGVQGSPQIAEEARAGLASKENFSAVTLRKADSFSRAGCHLPFRDVMLLQVKGRRYCQTRLVVPEAKSVNSGDCYILVTSDMVILWIGEFSNVIERSKASEVASSIHQKHDLGTKATCALFTVYEEKHASSSAALKFWKTLGAGDVCSAQAPAANEEDELYETFINETNLVYKMSGDELVKSGHCSKLLKHDMLHSKQAYVFDFGSEMYVWYGKHVPLDKRKKILKLAVQKWQAGYDYTEYNINPLCPLSLHDSISAHDSKRPEWALFGKVTQNMETVVFQEKFIDWPKTENLIRPKKDERLSKNAFSTSGSSYDVTLIAEFNSTPVSLLLEGSHVGRGDRWEDYEDGLYREFEIITHSVEVWHVSEYTSHPLQPSSYGQFHDQETYIVCWHYAVGQITHSLGGIDSRYVATGRPRCVYFFWQGNQSGVGQKGTSALMTIELDKEKGPQIPVLQGKEPACFIRLFQGHMIVHTGKRGDIVSSRYRLYIVRNELPLETYLWEVPVQRCSLRSRTSFVLVDCHKSSLYLWHGAKSPDHLKRQAQNIVSELVKRCPEELGLHSTTHVTLTEIVEGSAECTEFLEAMSDKTSNAYATLQHDDRDYEFTPRLFHMCPSSFTFDVVEVLNPCRTTNEDICSPFPFLQTDLYDTAQPAIFLFDNYYQVYLWIGWQSIMEGDNVNSVNVGLADTRFLAARRWAMETTIDYCDVRYPGDPPPAYIVYAGNEPMSFTNLFPHWNIDNTLINNNGLQGEDLELVKDVLSKLTEVHNYTLDELQTRPLPEGVDAQRLEMYLTDEEFQKSFGMSREDFSLLPNWKKTKRKQDVGLF